MFTFKHIPMNIIVNIACNFLVAFSISYNLLVDPRPTPLSPMIPARVKGRTHTEKLVTWIPWLHLVHLLKTSNMLSYSSTTWQYRKYMKIHERTVTTPLAHRLRDFPVPGWLPGVALCFHGLDLGFEKKKKNAVTNVERPRRCRGTRHDVHPPEKCR